MDIAPISNGHVLIIPKKPVSDAKQLPVSAFSLAKNIAKRISSLFKAKSTIIQTENKFGECVIHVIPSYTDQTLDLSAQRTTAKKEDLEATASKLRPKPVKKRLPLIKKETKTEQTSSPALSRQRRVP
jgi:diadenosine tetraphosphate (Ap4A) HIT family hydrolase